MVLFTWFPRASVARRRISRLPCVAPRLTEPAVQFDPIKGMLVQLVPPSIEYSTSLLPSKPTPPVSSTVPEGVTLLVGTNPPSTGLSTIRFGAAVSTRITSWAVDTFPAASVTVSRNS